MNDEALRDSAYWDMDGHGSDTEYDCSEDARPTIRKPIRTYSKRASFLHQIRAHSKWAAAHSDDDLDPPTQAAQEAAMHLINNLPEGCLDFQLAISQSGEINLFFGDKASPFQMLIDEDGLLSYFGMFGDERFAASDRRADDFQHMQLLRLLGTK